MHKLKQLLNRQDKVNLHEGEVDNKNWYKWIQALDSKDQLIWVPFPTLLTCNSILFSEAVSWSSLTSPTARPTYVHVYWCQSSFKYAITYKRETVKTGPGIWRLGTHRHEYLRTGDPSTKVPEDLGPEDLGPEDLGPEDPKSWGPCCTAHR